MANITRTYTFVNGQPADATQVNKDFDDVIAGVGDTATLRPTVASLGLDADIVTLVLPANTVISAAGAELINDADVAAQLVTLGISSPFMGASDTLQNSFDAEASTASASYVKLKSIRVPLSGIFRTKFDAYVTAAGKARVYVNGIARSAEQTLTTSYAIYSAGDIVVFAGDTIELWASGNTGTYYAYVKNFRLYGTFSMTPSYVQV
jgi:hypothetical protein